ncbi:MAG: hypothetical protein AABX38_01945 [Candidatus Micrarchaeota archaeon]
MSKREPSPKVKDIPEYFPKLGVTPKKIVLISPHTNESGAVSPFQIELAKKLRENGVLVEEHIVTDTMERGWSLRRHFNRVPYWNEAPIIANVLTLEDYLIRARVLKEAFRNSNNLLAVELHASAFTQDDEFANAHEFERISGTSILVLKNTLKNLDFLDLDYYKKLMQIFSEQKNLRFAYEIAKIRNLEIWQMIHELITLREFLLDHVENIRVFELPSKEKALPKNHPMYAHYYYDRLENEKDSPRITNAYEDPYCACTRESLGFSDQDVEAVKNVLVL